jgi:hypothetical protein
MSIPMRTALISLALLASLACAGASAAAGDEQRTFVNENVGKVSLSAPKSWKAVERHHINFGTTFYRLLPPKEGQFDFEILVNDLKHMEMDALVDKDLEIYIESNMASAARQSTEGKVKATRFGARADGVYARLTDKAPLPGEFILFTQGVRLQGNKVVLFTLYSNDRDGSILKQALAIVESVAFEK